MAPRVDFLHEILHLRVAVAFLGEKGQNGWWQTQFLQPTGQRFLEFIYPRTVFAAGVNAASEAAKNFHDDRIGKGGVIHLFRLPPPLELRLHEHLFKDFATLRQLIDNANTAKALLERYETKADQGSARPAGPVLVGEMSMIFSGKAASKFGEAYLRSIGSPNPVLPYLTDASE